MTGMGKHAPPLLELLAYRAGCEFLSDLHTLELSVRKRLARFVADLPPEAAGLQEWNDALKYLSGLPPAESPQAARGRLAEWLSAPGEEGVRGLSGTSRAGAPKFRSAKIPAELRAPSVRNRRRKP